MDTPVGTSVLSDLKVQVKNPDRVSLYLEGKFFCGLNMNQVLELKLKKGQELDPALQKSLKQQSQLGKAHLRTVEWLMRRPRSRRELNDYLFKKRLEAEEKDYVLQKVERYMDDEAFARFWIEGRKGSKAKSNRIISGELRAKGISQEVIDVLLSDHEVTDQQNLAKVIAKKSRQTRYQDPKKLTEYLLRQGFKYQDIKDVMGQD